MRSLFLIYIHNMILQYSRFKIYNIFVTFRFQINNFKNVKIHALSYYITVGINTIIILLVSHNWKLAALNTYYNL